MNAARSVKESYVPGKPIDQNHLYQLLTAAGETGLHPTEATMLMDLASDARPRVRRLMNDLVSSGSLRKEGKRYIAVRAPRPTTCLEGLLEVVRSGHAFVYRGATHQDIMVSASDLGGAIDGDTVEVEVWPQREGRQRGVVVRIVERGRRHVSGILEGPPWFLEAVDPRLPAVTVVEHEKWDRRRIPRGQVVLGDIVSYPERAGEPLKVRLGQVLGPPEHIRTEVARILISEGVVEGFSAEILHDTARIAPVDKAIQKGREDLRHLPFVTIDPVNARDFDDAIVSETHSSGNVRVWVAIADVAHYVRPGTALDIEAERRACSIYLPDRAIPMLPERLSADLCSLLPERDRLAMVVEMDVSPDGNVLHERCTNAIIRSRARLDYAGVAALFAGDLGERYENYTEWSDRLMALRDVSDALGRRRKKRGSLTLNLPETRVILDEDDPTRVRDICLSRSSEEMQAAYNLVEEFMLAANESIARICLREGLSPLWRIHQAPERDACEQLSSWLAAYGVDADPADLKTPAGMNKVLRKVAGHPAGWPLSFLCLRTLKQARYSAEHCGHFGLASEAYLHFTSPIRRYPDLTVHRLIKHWLDSKQLEPSAAPKTGLTRSQIAEDASQRERTAMDIERRVQSIFAASLIREQVGDVLEGTIVGFAAFGIFVRADHPTVEGLIHRERLPRHLRFSGETQQFIGRGVRYRLGDRLKVRVRAASLARGQIDFDLVSDSTKRRRKGSGKRHKGTR